MTMNDELASGGAEEGARAAAAALGRRQSRSEDENAHYEVRRTLAARADFLVLTGHGAGGRSGWFVLVQEVQEPPPTERRQSWWELAIMAAAGECRVVEERRLETSFEQQLQAARALQALVAGEDIADEATRCVLRAVFPHSPLDTPADLARFTAAQDALASFARGTNPWVTYMEARMRIASGDIRGVASHLETASRRARLLNNQADRALIRRLVAEVGADFRWFREEERQWLTGFRRESAHAPRPEMRTLPGGRTPHFTGRDEPLAEVRRRFTAGKHSCFALKGMAGAGKTQLALEYAHRYRRDYDYIFWVDASSAELLARDFDRLGDGMPTVGHKLRKDPAARREEILQWMCQHTGWLLIVDGAGEETNWDFLPGFAWGHVLITTRSQHLCEFPGLDVGSLPQDEAATLLVRRAGLVPEGATNLEARTLVGQYEWGLARELAERVGGLPLVLDQLGAWIAESQSSLAQLHWLFQTQAASILRDRGRRTFGHPDTALESLAQEVRCLAERDGAAADLLILCAVLAEAPVPETLLRDCASVEVESLAAIAQDPLAFDQAVVELRAAFLGERDPQGEALFIHPLVRIAVLETLDAAQVKAWRRRGILALARGIERAHGSSALPRGLLAHVQYGLALLEDRVITLPGQHELAASFRHALATPPSPDQRFS
jgi:hypothetical protein